jgi:hypothetical protein
MLFEDFMQDDTCTGTQPKERTNFTKKNIKTKIGMRSPQAMSGKLDVYLNLSLLMRMITENIG